MIDEEFPEMTDEQIQERYPHVASHLTAAHAYVKRYRQDGSDAKMTEAELCGLAEAWTFFESAESGLFDNRDDWNLHNAELMLDRVRPSMPGLDNLLDKSSQAIRALQNGEEPDADDLERAESLIYDTIQEITGKPPVYKG